MDLISRMVPNYQQIICVGDKKMTILLTHVIYTYGSYYMKIIDSSAHQIVKRFNLSDTKHVDLFQNCKNTLIFNSNALF